MIDRFSIAFEPLIALPWLIALAVPLVIFVLLGFMLVRRGAILRAIAAALLFSALLNPVVLREQRDPLTSVVAVVVDRSQSQDIGERTDQTDRALADLRARIGALPKFELRVAEAGGPSSSADRTQTRLFESLNRLLSDVPPSRVAGALFITDGQIHDVPEDAAAAGLGAPVHGLITGEEEEFDRRLRLERAPRFALVGEPVELAYRVLSEGTPHDASGPEHGGVDVTLRLNGEEVARQRTFIGEETIVSLELPNAGRSIVELEVDGADGELTTVNNTAIAQIDGIRENLRVLLVSGEPHAGERTWRNLLKSDAAVDLVHFTILRPPEKQDGTPINELSLIAFPTRELFVEKIEEFDLIILDRYQHRDVLPILYYDYIAQYVKNGGALLIAAGPEYASEQTIARTPLLPALPALPTGQVESAGFRPTLSEIGRRHPVTRGLDGAQSDPPQWSRWFRQIDVEQPRGQVVMEGIDEAPLLILDRFGEGRVGMLLSDQGWLWARGFEGGGPHVQLYRRIAHWLMKQPELEEERLVAHGDGMVMEITRQTMADEAPPAVITGPDGERLEVPLTADGPGIFSARLTLEDIGLHRVRNGDLATIAHIGAVNAPEFADTVSTVGTLADLAEGTGGTVRRVDGGLPAVVPIRPGTESSDRFLGLRETNDTVLRSVDRIPLFAGFIGLLLMLIVLGGMWWREGR